MIAYQPDNSALSPNILVSISQALPNTDGSYSAPYPPVATSYDTLGSGIVSMFLADYPSASSRLFAATNFGGTMRVYEGALGGTTWTLRATLTGSTTPHFCQYRDMTILANGTATAAAQYSSSGNFAVLGTTGNCPNGLVVDTVDDRLCFWNYTLNLASVPDGFIASDVGNETQYTPADSNQAYKTRVTDTPGPGTAMIRFRDFLVLFKKRGMYIAQPVGRPQIWDIRLLSANVGCVGKDACLVAEDILYFVDDQNVYAFDGAIIRSISDPYHTKTIVQALQDPNLATSVADTQLHYDDINKRLSIYLKNNSTGLSKTYCYNTVSGAWGYMETTNTEPSVDETVECVLNAPFRSLVTFTGLGVTTTSNENRVNFYVSNTGVSSLRNGHKSSTAGSAVTAWFGDPFKPRTLSRVYLNTDDPTSMTVAATMKRSPRTAGTTQASASAASFNSDMIADLMANGNFCKLTYAWNAQTHATPAVFRKWLDHIPEIK